MSQKFATIALVGAPNAGKSTLTNALLGQKITIVSPKVQTTRNVIKAILIDEDSQLILLDTPGVFLPRSDKILERIIVKSAWQGIRSSDFVCFLIDVSRGLDRENQRILNDLKKDGFSPAIILNKIDLIEKHKLLEITVELANQGFEDIFMISALKENGLEKLREFLFSKCIDGAWQYDQENITDAPMKAIASEITREKLFLYLDKEVPYSTTVKTDSYKVEEDGRIVIHQSILVQKESQKGIVLGKKGALIKKIGSESRRDIADVCGSRVALYLFVKIERDWMNHIENYEMVDIEKLPQKK